MKALPNFLRRGLPLLLLCVAPTVWAQDWNQLKPEQQQALSEFATGWDLSLIHI